MTAMTRRGVLAAAGTLAAATATGARGAAGGGGTGTGGNSLTWWDHQSQLQKAKAEIFAKFAKSLGGVPVHYAYYNPAKMGQALQPAEQSGQLPDIRTNAGLNWKPRADHLKPMYAKR
ncbi:hypothetical protein ACIBO2_44910 [Nonomuraea sp. NPDC050022]|uniref:hypothetical protein n=1 Tax=Nonomuraea sp. NPDC050022 TaxID=3364358 RepID=UPI00378AE86F